MSSILDAFGRPISKSEIEEAASQMRGAVMLPAHTLFQHSANSYDNLNVGSPFAYATDDGHLIDTSEERADYTSTLVTSSPYANLNDRFAHKNPIAELDMPRDLRGLMTLSMTHASENYIVSRAIHIKKNFALRSIEFLGPSKTKEFYDFEFRRLKMWKLLGHIYRYYWSVGRIVAYWGDERPIKRITLLDPRFIEVRRLLGQEIVFMHPDPRWRGILEKAKGLKNPPPEVAFLKKNLPKYWMPYVMNGTPIPLHEDSYALIENDVDLFSLRGLDSPNNMPLQPIFKQLATVNMLIAGDFSTAWMMKNMIALVSIGNPQTEKNYVRPDQGELQKLQAAFQRPEYALWAYVDPTVDVRFISPDPNLFNKPKYQQSVEAIEYTLGVPPVFSRDAAGDFGSSSLSLKAFREEIVTARQDIQYQLFDKLLPVMREGYVARKCGSKEPTISYDLDCLKDDRVLFDELNSKYDRGGLSVRSLLEGKVHDYDVEIERKKEEMPDIDSGLLAPAYDASHGTVDPLAEGGRPSTGNEPQSTTLSGQPSRPSRSA